MCRLVHSECISSQDPFPDKAQRNVAQRLDKAGIGLFTILLITLLLALGQIAEKGIANIMSLAAVAVFFILLWLFFISIERRAEQPLMPLRLFVRPIIAIASTSLFVTGIGMFGSVLLVPLFLQSIMGVSATSGALLTPLILTVAAASVVGGMTISHTKIQGFDHDRSNPDDRRNFLPFAHQCWYEHGDNHQLYDHLRNRYGARTANLSDRGAERGITG